LPKAKSRPTQQQPNRARTPFADGFLLRGLLLEMEMAVEMEVPVEGKGSEGKAKALVRERKRESREPEHPFTMLLLLLLLLAGKLFSHTTTKVEPGKLRRFGALDSGLNHKNECNF